MEFPYQNRLLVDLPGEVWKDIPSFEDEYQVSNIGRVRSQQRYTRHRSGVPLKIKPRILSQTIYKYYNNHVGDFVYALRVALSKDNKRYDFQVRRLVYQCFCGQLEPEANVINIDGNGFNNHFLNLKKVSSQEKQKRVFQRDRINPSLRYLDRSKFKKTYGGYSRQKPIDQLTMEGVLIASFPSISEASRTTGAGEKEIIMVAKGRWKQYKGCIWRYRI